MFERWKSLILAACVLAGITILASLAHKRQDDAPEPTYKGRSLSEWIPYETGIAEDTDPKVAEAVTHIGANAIPFLLKWIRFEPPHWRRDLLPKAQFWEWIPGFIRDPILNPYINSTRALDGFRYLGTNGVAAIPELTRLMNDTNRPVSSSRAVLALSNLGKEAFLPLLRALANPNPDPRLRKCTIVAIGRMGYLGTDVSPALPLLIHYTQNKDPMVAGTAASVLGHLQQEPQTVIPALTSCLNSTNTHELRRGALWGLGAFGKKARSAIPAILPILTDSDTPLRAVATDTILEIAPEVLTDARPH